MATCLFGLVAGSCNRNVPPAEPAGNASSALTETATSGEVTLTVTADAKEMRVAAPLRLTLEAKAPTDVEVELPDVPGQLEEFAVRDHGPVETETVGESRIWRQWFDIDSNLSGERLIPALTATFADGEVTAGPVTIEVISAIQGQFDPAEFAGHIETLADGHNRLDNRLAGRSFGCRTFCWWGS